MDKSGYFESISGNRSSARLIGFIIIVVALVFAQELLIAGISSSENLISIATAVGTLFLTIATPTMAYLFANKTTEAKRSVEEKKMDNPLKQEP